MFTEPKMLRAAQAMHDCELQQLLNPGSSLDPILTDHEIRDYLQQYSRFEEVQS